MPIPTSMESWWYVIPCTTYNKYATRRAQEDTACRHRVSCIAIYGSISYSLTFINVGWNKPKTLWSMSNKFRLIRNALSNCASWSNMPSRTRVIQWLLWASIQNLRTVVFCVYSKAPSKAKSLSSCFLFLAVRRACRLDSSCSSSVWTFTSILEARRTWKMATTIRIAWRWSILAQPKNMQNLQLSISTAADDFPIRLLLPLNLQIILRLCSNAYICEPNYGIILQFCRFGMHV